MSNNIREICYSGIPMSNNIREICYSGIPMSNNIREICYVHDYSRTEARD